MQTEAVRHQNVSLGSAIGIVDHQMFLVATWGRVAKSLVRPLTPVPPISHKARWLMVTIIWFPSIAPCVCKFRGASGRSDHCYSKSVIEQKHHWYQSTNTLNSRILLLPWTHKMNYCITARQKWSVIHYSAVVKTTARWVWSWSILSSQALKGTLV